MFNNLSPEQIAAKIFTEPAKEANSCQLLTDEKQINKNTEYSFEILITILLEGLNIIYNGLDKIELTNIKEEEIKKLNPWFQSLGFNLKFNEIFTLLVPEHYCKVILNNGSDSHFFITKNINKNYHFLLNPIAKNLQEKKLSDYYALFIVNSRKFKISFDFHIEIKKDENKMFTMNTYELN